MDCASSWPSLLDTSSGDGVDTLDFSGVTVSTGVTIDLGNTSSAQKLNSVSYQGVYVFLHDLFGAVIGTDKADTIIGNNLDNIIDGGADSDSLTGGQGNDRYVFEDGFGVAALGDRAHAHGHLLNKISHGAQEH